MGRIPISEDELLQSIVRLRRAERAAPAVEEIAEVRGELEDRLGPTVSRAVAARALGVSQTALDRWVARGDIAAVVTPRGRREIPTRGLVDLTEAVKARVANETDRHPLASVIHQRRSDAAKLDPKQILPSRYRRPSGGHGHRRAELRALAYHRALAQRLDERALDGARERLRGWRSDGRIDPRYAAEWEKVLSWPIPRIAKLISGDSERARDLRQSSPFAGLLDEQERHRILEIVG